MDSDATENIKVAVRLRPVDEAPSWRAVEKSVIAVSGNEQFQFDEVFAPQIVNDDIYKLVDPLVEATINGYNTAICAYGQSGSGKTHTLTGTAIETGVVQYAIASIFSAIERESERNFMVRLSYMEIYNENVRDLLSENDRDENVQILEKNMIPVVFGITDAKIRSETDALELLDLGLKRRIVGETVLNSRSSRSHSILRLTIESNATLGGIKSRTSIMNLVDLAGSEDASLGDGTRQREGISINKSLLTLSKVIAILSDKKKGSHVPYRESKLTRILKPCLGGNSKTLVICCVNPAATTETGRTLKFARQAKQVEGRPVVNEDTEDGPLSIALAEIEALKKQLQEKEKQTADNVEEKEKERQSRLQDLFNSIIPAKTATNVDKTKKARRMTWAPGNNIAKGFGSPIARWPPKQSACLSIPESSETRPPPPARTSLPNTSILDSSAAFDSFALLHDRSESENALRSEFALRRKLTESEEEYARMLEEKNAEISKLKAKTEELATEIETLEKSKEDLRKEQLEMLQQMSVESNRAEETRKELDDLRDQLSTLSGQHAVLNQKYKIAEIEAKKMGSEFATLEAEHQRLLCDTMGPGERQKLVFRAEELHSERSQLLQDLSNLKMELAEAKDESESLKRKVSVLQCEKMIIHNEAENEKNELRAKIDSLRLAHEKSREEYDELICQQNSELNKLRVEISQSDKEWKLQKEGELTRCQLQLAEKQLDVGRLEHQLETLRPQIIADIQQKVEKKMKDDGDLIRQLQIDLERAKELNSRLLAETTVRVSKESDYDMEETETAIEAPVADNLPDESDCNTADVFLPLSSSEKTDMEVDQSSLEERHREEIQGLSAEIDRLKSKVLDMSRQLENKREALDLCQSRVTVHRNEAAEATENLAEKSEALDHLEVKYEKLVKEVKLLTQERQALQDLCIRLRRDRDSARSEATNLRALMEEKTKEAAFKVATLEADLTVSQKEIASLTAKLSARTEENEAEKVVESDTTELQSLRKRIADVEEKLAQTEKTLAECERLKKLATSRYVELENELAKLNDNMDENQKRLMESERFEKEKAQKELVDAKQEIEKLLKERENGYKYIALLKQDIAALEKNRLPLKDVTAAANSS